MADRDKRIYILTKNHDVYGKKGKKIMGGLYYCLPEEHKELFEEVGNRKGLTSTGFAMIDVDSVFSQPQQNDTGWVTVAPAEMELP